METPALHFASRILHHLAGSLPLVIIVLSVAIFVGCALAAMFCPGEKKDCMFHREVY